MICLRPPEVVPLHKAPKVIRFSDFIFGFVYFFFLPISFCSGSCFLLIPNTMGKIGWISKPGCGRNRRQAYGPNSLRYLFVVLNLQLNLLLVCE